MAGAGPTAATVVVENVHHPTVRIDHQLASPTGLITRIRQQFANRTVVRLNVDGRQEAGSAVGPDLVTRHLGELMDERASRSP